MTANPLMLRGEAFDRAVLETMRDLGTASLREVIAVMGGQQSAKTKFRESLARLRHDGEIHSWMGGPRYRPTRYFSVTAEGSP